MKTTLHYIIAILFFSLNATHVFAEENNAGPFNITAQTTGITYNYDAEDKILTIGGGGSLTITGDESPVEAGIVIQTNSKVSLTMNNLHIKAKVPLTVNANSEASPTCCNLILQGTNILESKQKMSNLVC